MAAHQGRCGPGRSLRHLVNRAGEMFREYLAEAQPKLLASAGNSIQLPNRNTHAEI